MQLQENPNRVISKAAIHLWPMSLSLSHVQTWMQLSFTVKETFIQKTHHIPRVSQAQLCGRSQPLQGSSAIS